MIWIQKIIKKIAEYHQYHAVQKAVERIVSSSKPEGDKKGGVVWHTQGAGKSLEMEAKIMMVVFLTMLEIIIQMQTKSFQIFLINQ